MNVLVACEFSGVVRRAFRARGHDAWSCDLEPAEDGDRHHIQHDCLEIVGSGWNLVIAHPPCTYLCNSGVRHLHPGVAGRAGGKAKVNGMERWHAMLAAARFFSAVARAPGRVAIENPVPHRYARERIGWYTQLIQPWQFGHGETKATCLWLKNLPLLRPTKVVDGRAHRIHHLPPSENRARERSRTYEGIAKAMVEQWG